MEVPTHLTMTQTHYERLLHSVMPDDGREAVAFLLCSRRDGDRRKRLLVREVVPLPSGAYSHRSPTSVTWSTDALVPYLERAERERLSVVKVHGHITGYESFSATDDVADAELLPLIQGWTGTPALHGSVVALPSGCLFGRVLGIDGRISPLESIEVVGDDILFWNHTERGDAQAVALASHSQIFGEGTTNLLRGLSVGVVGCSGTGSPLIEQLVRLGVGELVLVDDDIIEMRNVNRIINSTVSDARSRLYKVDMMAAAIQRIGLGTRVVPISKSLWDREAVLAIAQCDIVLGCMDSIDGRFLLNTLATHYLIPYFDLGVRIDAGSGGGVRDVCGSIHYLQPGRSSLLSRGLFDLADVSAAGLRRHDPAAHGAQQRDGYIHGVDVAQPAVIFLNMHAASLAINEFLARLHPFREEPNSQFASVTFSLGSMELFCEEESGCCNVLEPGLGLGDVEPLLGLVELALRAAA